MQWEIFGTEDVAITEKLFFKKLSQRYWL